MIGIDTNVLVRYITQDDELQADIATKFFKEYENQEKKLFINNIVLCEINWVLKRAYRYSKDEIISTIKQLLMTMEFEFENHELAWIAINEYAKSSADFSDHLIGRSNELHGCRYTVTFDQQALKAPEFKSI